MVGPIMSVLAELRMIGSSSALAALAMATRLVRSRCWGWSATISIMRVW
jgi:hypothetical protein